MTNTTREVIREISLEAPRTSPVAQTKLLLLIRDIKLPAAKATITPMIPVNLSVKNPKMMENTREASKNFQFI
jgi:hypothetical protein